MKLSAKIIITLINLIVNLIEGLLAMRIILKLFNANASAPFVTWIYETTAPLLEPFIGMFPSPQLEFGLMIEFTSLFALAVYAFVGYLASDFLESIAHKSAKSK